MKSPLFSYSWVKQRFEARSGLRLIILVYFLNLQIREGRGRDVTSMGLWLGQGGERT